MIQLTKKDNKYYPQVILEECKYAVKERKIHSYIIDDLEIWSFDSDDGLLEKNQMEKNSDYEENSNEGIMEITEMQD